MKSYFLQSLRLTALMILLLCVIYPLLVAYAAKFSAGGGDGEKIYRNGKTAGYVLLGQSFTRPEYFWGRPSAAGYHADASGGSNKGPADAVWLQTVAARADTLLKYHPYLKKEQIPADMVTASGSGLDPCISPQGAAIQLRRVAAVRRLPAAKVAALIAAHTSRPLFGLFGPAGVNVLQLNLALDDLNK